MELNQTQKTLLGVVGQALTGKEYSIPANTDWAALFAESKAQAVIPMAFSGIAHRCTDKEVFNQWKVLAVRSLQKNRTVHLQHGALHQLLTEHHIPYTSIKGFASALDYPDPLLRAMGDVDFLVPQTHWEQAKEVLISEGFVTSGEDHPFHLSFDKKGFNMEMHREPFGLTGEGAEALQDIVPELIDASAVVTHEGVDSRIPDRFGHGIVLLLHAYRHLVGDGIGVRHLCDWAAFISGFSGDEFAHIFEERFRKLGIWKMAQIFGMTAHRYLAIPYQEWMGEVDEEVCQILMIDIFNGGNFGRKNGERKTQNRAIFAQNQELAEGNRTVQLMRSLNQTAIEHYPRLMNIKILRPFGWGILGARYVFRVLTGKRKKVPTGTMQMATLRRELYQQFAVFKTEQTE